MKNLRLKLLHFMEVLLLSIILSGSFLAYIETINASSEPTVRVKPSICFAHTGETFTINITVENVQNLYGLEVSLYWNASILEITNVDVRLGKENYTDGVLYNPVHIHENQTFPSLGKYTLAASSAAPAPSFNGTGNIVRITFRVIGSGCCELSLETILTSNIIPPGSTVVETIAHTIVNGFFGPILLTAYPKQVMVGKSVNVSGLIATPQAGVNVTIFYKHEEETEWHALKTKTDEQGRFSYIWTPEKSGKYYIKATAYVLGNQEISPIIFINVSEPQQSPWLYIFLSVAVIVIIAAIVVIAIYRKTIKPKNK
ncbi:MAG TPA: hypothetical protein ENG19_01450 [Candidatus Bathyarchaeota archaeon]|nr:hypothetical protein [Candidatus Bathyarchaeota archaeon]